MAEIIAAPKVQSSEVNLDSQKLDNLMNLSGELAIIRARYAQLVGSLSSETTRLRSLESKVALARSKNEAAAKELKTSVAGVRKTGSASAETAALLAEIAAELAGSATFSLIHSLDEMTSALGKISADIQTWVMLSRLIPVGEVFGEVSQRVLSFNREAKITSDEAGASLDKRIADGLVRQLGEASIALAEFCGAEIKLAAQNRENNVWLEITASGGKFSAAQVPQVFLRKGLLPAEQAAALAPKQALHMLLRDDFPEGDALSPLAKKLQSLRLAANVLNGALDIDAEADGVLVSLKIPLTLVIVKALLVSFGGETYAFPLSSVVEIVKVAMDEIYSIDGNNTIKLRDHALSLVDLQHIMGLDRAADAKITHRKIVVITNGDEKIGIPVDTLIGEEEIVIKNLPEHFSTVKGINGASVLGDGSVALVLDPAAILSLAR